MEFNGRLEENDFFAVTLKNLGHAHFEFHEIPGVNHGQAGDAVEEAITGFIRTASMGNK